MLIYKIFRADEYAAFASAGRSDGAPVDLQDGYIHASTATQVEGTARKHFAGEAGLMLLALDADTLTPLKWEVSRGGEEFPHLYRALTTADVVWSRPLPLVDGRHDFTGLL
ncbi:DUF952 domain-containing protein [Oceanibium sediminis]|uniref:DUF952 domain-containing protein n=1 Tax=Oceanibium sediminis TaxID=2026339 RepID=UPI000DD3600F|nr:DUF952 domain-containing protein [Oceanibium sediminis]